MPQIFDKIEELQLVDWDTLVIYTCTNSKCLPDFSKNEFYQQEFGWVQLSNDFAHVNYGDDAQIEEQKKSKRLQNIHELSKEEEEEIEKVQQEIADKFKKQDEENANKKAGKKQKQKEKKAQKE